MEVIGWSADIKSKSGADGGTGCENHADILQEGLVLYLEVGEQEDNLKNERL